MSQEQLANIPESPIGKLVLFSFRHLGASTQTITMPDGTSIEVHQKLRPNLIVKNQRRSGRDLSTSPVNKNQDTIYRL